MWGERVAVCVSPHGTVTRDNKPYLREDARGTAALTGVIGRLWKVVPSSGGDLQVSPRSSGIGAELWEVNKTSAGQSGEKTSAVRAHQGQKSEAAGSRDLLAAATGADSVELSRSGLRDGP